MDHSRADHRRDRRDFFGDDVCVGSVRTFLPVALATGTATFIGRVFLGQQPAFAVPALPSLDVDLNSALLLGLYAVLGVLMGLAAALFIRSLHFVEDQFDKIAARYTRHIVGMAIVGINVTSLF